jgi:hypothetical protein
LSELGSTARELVRAGRDAHKPSPADRERIARALEARLGADSMASNGGAPSPVGVTPRFGGKLWALGGAGLAVGGALVALSFGFRQGDAPPLPSAAPAAAAPVADVKVEAEPSVPPASATPLATLPLEPRAPGARRGSSRLAEEVAILSRAETELHAGRAASALAVLEEHRQKFPNGALAQERIAARIHALCALGRVTEAEAALARLKRVSPGSPQEGRAREACAPIAKR